MLSLRWFDPEPDDLSTPADWRLAALITATLFLNLPFWYLHGTDLWMSCALPLYAVRVEVVALTIAALFFVGPALACQAAKRPLLGIIENSLGSIPAYGLRLCCVSFLALWIARLIAWPGLGLLPFILRREVSSIESGAFSLAILAFILFTGLQSLQTSAKLALFTNKLGLAILIAALIRVHQGWPAAPKGYPTSSRYSEGLALWQGLSQLAFYVAPLAFLAANFGYRSNRRKPVMTTALMGIAVPLAGTLLLVGVTNVAMLAAGFYQPSLQPNIAMALWGHAARSALPSRVSVAAITTFGAMRFGIMTLAESVSMQILRSRWRLIPLGFLVGAVLWLTANRFVPSLDAPFEVLTACLAVSAAVLTVDFVAGPWRVERVRRFDWVGVVALLAGLAAPLFMPDWIVGASDDPWWHPWLLPSYGVAFLVCLLGRTEQGAVARRLERHGLQ